MTFGPLEIAIALLIVVPVVALGVTMIVISMRVTSPGPATQPMATAAPTMAPMTTPVAPVTSQQQLACPKCGGRLEGDERFCPTCGTPLHN